MKNTRFILTLLLILLTVISTHVFATSQEAPIVCHENKKSFALKNVFHRISKYFYNTLNFSPFFNVKKLLSPERMREELLTPFQGGGQLITVKTEDGEQIDCTFFDRNSNTLLVVGTGFGNEREKVAPFVHMFPKYDIIIFDYRGHGLTKPDSSSSRWSLKQIAKKAVKKLTSFLNLSKAPNIDLRKTTFGENEDKDLLAVINHQIDQKKYAKLYGIGLCFSSHIFAKFAATYKKSFDKLILDSSLYSIQKLIDRVTESPQLIIDPQRGKLPGVIQSAVNACSEHAPQGNGKNVLQSIGTFCKNTLSKTVLCKEKIPTTKTTAEYLSELPTDIPVLFYHGNDDVMTTYEEDFLNNLNKSKLKKKIGISFKKSRHLINHIKYKEEYACISNLFFELPFKEFVECLKDPDKFLEYKLGNIRDEILGYHDNRVPFSTSPETVTISNAPAESFAKSIIP